jgi:hypothetical protein
MLIANVTSSSTHYASSYFPRCLVIHQSSTLHGALVNVCSPTQLFSKKFGFSKKDECGCQKTTKQSRFGHRSPHHPRKWTKTYASILPVIQSTLRKPNCSPTPVCTNANPTPVSNSRELTASIAVVNHLFFDAAAPFAKTSLDS